MTNTKYPIPNTQYLRRAIVFVICHLSLVIGYSLPVSAALFPLPASPTDRFGTGEDLPTRLINGFINPILIIFSFLAVLYIVLAGFKFVRSSGDPKGAEEARRRLIFAILGFVILILATAITQIINRIVLRTNTI